MIPAISGEIQTPRSAARPSRDLAGGSDLPRVMMSTNGSALFRRWAGGGRRGPTLTLSIQPLNFRRWNRTSCSMAGNLRPRRLCLRSLESARLNPNRTQREQSTFDHKVDSTASTYPVSHTKSQFAFAHSIREGRPGGWDLVPTISRGSSSMVAPCEIKSRCLAGSFKRLSSTVSWNPRKKGPELASPSCRSGSE